MAVIKTIQESSLTALGDAIRAKGGTNELLEFPTGMIDAINNIETGGGSIEVEPIKLGGMATYACAGPLASTYIKLFGNTITTNDLDSAQYMFYNYQLASIPFELNFKQGTNHDLSSCFYNAQNLTELPKCNNVSPSNMGSLFYGCHSLRNIPDNYVDDWSFSRFTSYAYANQKSLFQNCYSLRKIPDNLLKNLWSIATSASYIAYNTGWYYCVSLDEIVGIPIQPSTLTSNTFSSAFTYCQRLKDIIFAANEDGTPKTAKWKSQTIDLTNLVGYTNISYKHMIVNYNSGITADKEVKDDATYQALKNDPDWFTQSVDYSRYNHDSAVNTINSLPDCSATGTNTIKFKGAAGAKTDGGAINTLTEEEIAVATAKGWTVTLS